VRQQVPGVGDDVAAVVLRVEAAGVGAVIGATFWPDLVPGAAPEAVTGVE